MKKIKISVFAMLIATVFALAISGCVEKAKLGTSVGETKPLGNGMVRTWVTLDNDGNPLAVGVTLTEAALSGLPTTLPTTEYQLALPKQASAMPFTHIVVNWNPQGHIPPGIYDVPHFDFHFYMISPEERYGITATGDDLAKVEKKPAPEFIPAGYVPTPRGEPRMGAHWINPASPEFNNKSFTRTFIYGFYGGTMAFLEPMVTVAYLETKTNFSDAIKLPEKYLTSAYYPTRYSVRYDAATKEYTVSLEGMMLQK